jgi:hypothetical protein
MPSFYVADLTPQGELHSQEEYRYEELEMIPGAAELIGVFSGQFWQAQEEFTVKLEGGMTCRLNHPSPTTGIATLRQSDDKLLTLSLLLTGLNADADQITLASLQTHILRELHGTPFEPAFSLLQITARPMVASIHLGLPDDPALRRTFALCDRCLAAAYFRYHGLA